MDKKLNKIRKKIDNLDKSLVKLLNNRSYLINEAKQLKENLHPKIRFARETLMSYSLQKKDFGLYNLNFMQKIWRELISASLLIEGELNIEVYTQNNHNISPLWVLARDHFGSYANITTNTSLEQIINNLQNNTTTLGVFPFPHENINWWDYLINYPNIKVNLTLPFLPPPLNLKSETGVIVSKAQLEESIEDSSLFLIKTKNFNPLSNIKVIFSKNDQYLVILNGFTKNKALVSRFTNVPVDQIFYLGSYPKPMFN